MNCQPRPSSFDAPSLTVWTIGHSTRTADEFLTLLKHYHIEAIADVRLLPGSRRYPQYDRPLLQRTLEQNGIDYLWLPSLGGRRRAAPDSLNTAWRNASFRGYADHLQSEEFAQGFVALLNLAYGMRTAMMCAEAVWWRCHRSLIADVLCSLGISVLHISSATSCVPHPYTSPARIVEGRLTYEAAIILPTSRR